MEKHRKRGGRGPRHGREIRREGGLLSQAGALRIEAVEARPVQGDGRRVAGGGPVHAAQAAAHRQARVRPARFGEGLRGRVLVGATVCEALARGASAPVGRVSGARVASGRGAGRFRHGAGRGRRGPGRRALPGRDVPVFEHALLRGPARGERGMRVRGTAHGVRAHRRGPPDAGARQRHRRRSPGRVGQGQHRQGVRTVRGALPAGDQVLQSELGQ
ncbi:DNA replication protein [Bifidobacterium bifidum]|nr:DNA replication protein [Bifidobacterium bifidum]